MKNLIFKLAIIESYQTNVEVAAPNLADAFKLLERDSPFVKETKPKCLIRKDFVSRETILGWTEYVLLQIEDIIASENLEANELIFRLTATLSSIEQHEFFLLYRTKNPFDQPKEDITVDYMIKRYGLLKLNSGY